MWSSAVFPGEWLMPQAASVSNFLSEMLTKKFLFLPPRSTITKLRSESQPFKAPDILIMNFKTMIIKKYYNKHCFTDIYVSFNGIFDMHIQHMICYIKDYTVEYTRHDTSFECGKV